MRQAQTASDSWTPTDTVTAGRVVAPQPYRGAVPAKQQGIEALRKAKADGLAYVVLDAPGKPMSTAATSRHSWNRTASRCG
jgi:hypothetical protein